MAMREEYLKVIRDACLKANPEIEVRNSSMMLKGTFTGLINHRDTKIRVADVLLALESIKSREHTYWIDCGGQFASRKFSEEHESWLHVFWNLRADNLNEQSDECVAFIAELLK